ncbi:hypothetical protein HDU78_003742 [Chytriomyces hyalinus]|uniref:Ser-Thr-rich glycosyl-phosphatidyl-inositol-anchored membrane family-domain-containing protein n=1 Tax=Chytriomyces confervae TaxID=246404 RepID=A0A507FI51_9FUNG|nr:hypothetical protein HDU77_008540 [Chytriomyces hyalinus]KAJ3247629.1 hypothetical protein HDU78_003742 [Chytriomyces hyalinus]KAJ3402237.1 hypothetical protein HDU80_005258 [Chytriomyces hyalinus]TPX75984.1 hypothetical protein CcCBS67573_g02723 [Chytriomyces confervae]
MLRIILAVVAAVVSVVAQTSAPSAPSAPTTSNSMVLISPNGNLAYKSGDPITITWNINTDAAAWRNTQVTFEIADASQGANKVTPFAMLNGTANIGDLQMQSTIPANIPAGGAYCVRADVRGTSGFTYFFSPNFPINQALGAAAPTTAAAAPAASATAKAAAVSPTSVAAVTSKPSNAERFVVSLVAIVGLFVL